MARERRPGGGWQRLENIQYLLPRAKGSGPASDCLPDQISRDCEVTRRKRRHRRKLRHMLLGVAAGGFFTLGSALVMAVGTIVAAVMHQSSGVPQAAPQAAAPPAADICLDAREHFMAANQLRKPELRKLGLQSHLRRYPMCSYAPDAELAIADIEAQLRAMQTPPPIKPAKAATPPSPDLLVTPMPRQPRWPDGPMAVGFVANIQPRTAYHLVLARNYATAILVVRGSVILSIDGKRTLLCYAGVTFHMYTEGFSSFDLYARSRGAQIMVVGIERGWHQAINCVPPPSS